MASASTKAATTKSDLTPSMTLKGHGNWIYSLSYFPDGQRMISGSLDKTARQWDLKTGAEIEGARGVCEEGVLYAVAVSRDDRWVVTGGGDYARGELKACEVKTGIVKTFEGHSLQIYCIDVSAGNTLLASGSEDETARIWNLETGEFVAGPFKSIGFVGAVRFSPDSKKLAVKSDLGTCLEVWDVQSQKLDVRIGKPSGRGIAFSPIFWSNKNKTIIAAFKFDFTADSDQYDNAKTIYEFDAVTLETVGAPFEGHTKSIGGLALSFDGALLASASYDNTIKLWAFASRQLLASFNIQVHNIVRLILSPDSRQLAYIINNNNDYKICICDTPPGILAQARIIARKKLGRRDILDVRVSSFARYATHQSPPLQSDATRRPPAGHRRPRISAIPIVPRPSPTRDAQQPTLLRLGKFLRFSPPMNALRPGRKDQSRDPLDFPATLPLPPNRLHADSSPLTSLPGGRASFNPIRSPSDKGKQKAREPKRKAVKVVDVPLGQATYGDVVGVDDGIRPYVLFFCLSWFQKKEKKQEPRPVYDDELEDDDEEENALGPVSLTPPRVQHEEIELKPVASQSQLEAGPSRLALTDHLKAQSS
ncbi:quinon protein alcohol dehydrogenase-like superfamily [Suillus subaureus]|uniref:Quinon protein alcohol dehydrogenase-like superfamily n=1 Tax=Suillus subaureus TaxID=48587 RepID=A0A9P7E051_9AGAM|nr:quinon protein alcohol dehydrogenase-like superfamily [Suillus subaureus]KAG1807271.1 quinon protein alcohol dehydrogenase-like superfamily [Suillus subaureus]